MSGPVAWRFYSTGSATFNDHWTAWSAETSHRELCEKLGFKAEFAYPAETRSALVEALKDALNFVQRHSYRWDSTAESASKHPQLIVDNSIAALKAAGVEP